MNPKEAVQSIGKREWVALAGLGAAISVSAFAVCRDEDNKSVVELCIVDQLKEAHCTEPVLPTCEEWARNIAQDDTGTIEVNRPSECLKVNIVHAIRK